MKNQTKQAPAGTPSLWVSLIPLFLLICLLVVVIKAFGTDALAGGIQIALLLASAVCVALSTLIYKTPWERLEGEVVKNIKDSAVAIIILLMIGAITGTWMLSGVVPTLICYGLEIQIGRAHV